MVCTSDLFARREEGKAVGLETVTTVFDEVSARVRSVLLYPTSFAPISPTLVVCAADCAGQHDILLAGTAVQQVSTVSAEDERSDSRHFGVVLRLLCV